MVLTSAPWTFPLSSVEVPTLVLQVRISLLVHAYRILDPCLPYTRSMLTVY